MTKLEQALSKRALETLDLIRFQRGFRTRAKTLEVILLEAETGDTIRLTPAERRITNQRLESLLQGNTVPASQVFAALDAKRRNTAREPWDKLIPTGTFGNREFYSNQASATTEFQAKLVSLISDLIIAKSSDLLFLNQVFVRGYEEQEIIECEQRMGFPFPKMYREFLGVIGKFRDEAEKRPFRFCEDNNIFGGIISLQSVEHAKQIFVSEPSYQALDFDLPPIDENIIFYSCSSEIAWEYFIANNSDPKVFHFNVLEGVIELDCTFSERVLFLLNRRIKQVLGQNQTNHASKSAFYRVP